MFRGIDQIFPPDRSKFVAATSPQKNTKSPKIGEIFGYFFELMFTYDQGLNKKLFDHKVS
jgi:hypothetical protein